jgi:hypothetical protein
MVSAYLERKPSTVCRFSRRRHSGRFFVPYRSNAEIERCIQATRAVLATTAAMARKLGAVSLVVDPQFGPEGRAERMVRRRILDEPGIPYVQVVLDPAWHLNGDLHLISALPTLSR